MAPRAMGSFAGLPGRFVPAASGAGRRALGAVLSWGLVLDTLFMFVLSGGVLWTLGLNYDGLTGSAAAKLHPATYFTALLLLWSSLAAGNPVGYFVRVVRARPAALVLLIVGVLFELQIVSRSGPGLAGTIDTWIFPALLALVLVDCDERTQQRIETVIHVVMAVNALLGLFEFLTQTALFPYRFDGVAFPNETRSSALQGHPLGNALVTAHYIACLVAGGGTRLGPALRAGMVTLQLIGLITFGGRSATVITVLGLAYAGLAALLHLARRPRVPLLAAAMTFVAVGLGPIVAAALAQGGFFDRLAMRFVSDGGSAQARVQMFDLFDSLSMRDLLVGPDSDLVDSLRRIAGLEWGIENPIVHMLLYSGALMTLLVLIGFSLYVREVMRQTRPGAMLPLVVFLVLLNTAETLAGKSIQLGKFALVMIVLFRPLAALRTAPKDPGPP